METKEIVYIWDGKSEHGRSTIIILCPFCKREVEAYIWSWHGHGMKKCPCGARLGVNLKAKK